MSWQDTLRAQLSVDEGYRKMPYTDSVGKLTIGVGRNLTDVGLHDDEISMLLANDMAMAESAARALLNNFDDLSDTRKAVICNMAFNLGAHTLGTFHSTLQAIRDERWDDAASAMLASQWAQQVGARAQRQNFIGKIRPIRIHGSIFSACRRDRGIGRSSRDCLLCYSARPMGCHYGTCCNGSLYGCHIRAQRAASERLG